MAEEKNANLLVVHPRQMTVSLSEEKITYLGRRYPRTNYYPDLDFYPNLTVSRKHARIWFENGQWQIEDLGSVNNTMLNGAGIRDHGAKVLSDGDIIQIGTDEPEAPVSPQKRGENTVVFNPQPSYHYISHKGILLKFRMIPEFCYSLWHSGVPLIMGANSRNLKRKKTTSQVMQFELGGIGEGKLKIPPLDPGQERVVDCQLFLNMKRVETLSQRKKVHVIFKAEDQELYLIEKFWLLAYNEIPISGEHTQYWKAIATFVLPNHPKVKKVVSDAESSVKDMSTFHLLAQEGGEENVKAICEAIYQYVAKKYILSYRHEPPGIGPKYQQVRLPHQLFNLRKSTGDGTCLDLAIFLASCCEQAEIWPILVLFKGHMIVGSWNYDHRQLIDKALLDADEWKKYGSGAIFVEPTCLSHGGPFGHLGFDGAMSAAEELLDREKPIWIIDILKAREEGILPIPFHGEPNLSPVVEGVEKDIRECLENGEKIGSPYILYLLLKHGKLLRKAFERDGIDPDHAKEVLQKGRSRPSTIESILSLAREKAKLVGSDVVLEEHLIMSLNDIKSVALNAALKLLRTEKVSLQDYLSTQDRSYYETYYDYID